MSFIAVGIGVGTSLLGGAMGAIGAGKAKRAAERKAKKAAREMRRLKNTYAQLDTSNPYLNMENTMEDMTINQKQAQFQAQQFQQSQANILNAMRGSAGGSGIAATAQALAQQGQIASQKSAADIGRQEAANQAAERQMAGQLQAKERAGDVWSRGQEKEKVSTLLGMAQEETSAYRDQAAAAQQAKWDAISGGITGAGDAVMGGLEHGAFSKKKTKLDQFGNVAGPEQFTSDAYNQPWMEDNSNTGTSTLGEISIID